MAIICLNNHWAIGLTSRVFANGPKDRFNPRSNYTKDSKIGT